MRRQLPKLNRSSPPRGRHRTLPPPRGAERKETKATQTFSITLDDKTIAKLDQARAGLRTIPKSMEDTIRDAVIVYLRATGYGGNLMLPAVDGGAIPTP